MGMKHRASLLTRARRGVPFALARPSVMVALAAILSFEITTLPIDPVRDGGESVIGRMIARSIVGREQVVFNGAREVAVFVARNGDSPTGFEIIDPDLESMDRITRILRESPDSIAPIGVLARPVARGWWRPTHVDHAWAFRVPRTWTSEDQSRAILTLVQHLEAQGEPELVALARSIADNRLAYVRWTGYAHNALDATLFVGFIVSCAWLLPGSGWRTRRALRRGTCPKCAYSLKNLEPDALGANATRCPECGQTWAIAPPAADGPSRTREQSHEKA